MNASIGIQLLILVLLAYIIDYLPNMIKSPFNSNSFNGLSLLFSKPSLNQLLSFSIELTIVVLVLTILFFLGIEIGRGIIIGNSLKDSLRDFKEYFPTILKYHSMFKLIFLIVMVVSLALVFSSLSFSNVKANPFAMATNILIAISLLLLLIQLLVLTNYPTFKILSGYKNLMGLVAYTFSLPSIIFSVLFLLYFALIIFMPKILQIIWIFLSFFVSWVFYHISKLTEKYYKD